MARRKTTTTTIEAAPGKRRRGGRKPGVWKLVTAEQLKEYRSTNKVSRARVAQMLGVSSTSVQNWETGTVASMKVQQRLAELFAAGPAAIVAPRRAPSLWEGNGARTSDPAVVTTGTIVTSYLQGQKGMSAEELVALIRGVRQALS